MCSRNHRDAISPSKIEQQAEWCFSVCVTGGVAGQLFHLPWSTVEANPVLIVGNKPFPKTLGITPPLHQIICPAVFLCFLHQFVSCHPFALRQPPCRQPTLVSSAQFLESWIFCIQLFLLNFQGSLNLLNSLPVSGSATIGPR